ncbi:MAG: ATP-binding protein [Polyangiaceae bacterium]
MRKRSPRRGAEHEIALVTSTDDAGRAVIEVRDTGVGIPPLLMQRIFDPFVTTKPRGEAPVSGSTFAATS